MIVSKEPSRNYKFALSLPLPARPPRRVARSASRSGRLLRRAVATPFVAHAHQARQLGNAVGGLGRTRLRATGGTEGLVGSSGAGVGQVSRRVVGSDQGLQTHQIGFPLISLVPPPPPTLPPSSKATDPGPCSTTADRITIAGSPAATAGAHTPGGNAAPATASAAPAVDQATGPLCAGALLLSSDEALTEGSGSSSLGCGMNEPYQTLQTVLVLTRAVMFLILLMPPMILA